MNKRANKRRNKRIGCHVPVDGKEGSVFEATKTVDISKTGLGFVSERRIPINKRIPIQLDLSENENPIFVMGKVKWVKSIPNSGRYRVGVNFESLLGGSQSRLSQYFRK